MISAASRAISTAPSTEIPISAARRAGGIVDAVAHKAHHVPFTTQQSDDAFFVHRRQAGKQRGAQGKLGQLIVGQVLNVAPHHDVACVQAHFVAHFGRHQLAVAGQDFDGDPARFQRFQRRRGGLFRRIEECDVTSRIKSDSSIRW